MKKNDLIDDWLTQEVSPEDRLEMERIISLTENLEAPALTTKEAAWDGLMSRISEEADDNEHILNPTVKRRSWIMWAASAAAVLVAGYFTFFNGPDLMTLSTDAGETLSEVLPDQSKVTVNAASSISFNKDTWDETRAISLKGEAFFEVTEGATFTVSSDNGQVTVLGTSFNVFDRNNQLHVQCFTGKVKVTAQGDEVIITKNQSATIDGKTGRLVVEEFNPQKTATWRIGEFYFDAVKLSEVIEELERQFGIEIQVSADISNRFYNGFFSNESLTEALQLVFVPMGFTTSVNGSVVTVE